MLNRRKFLELSAAALAAPTVLSRGARADGWPSKQVRIVVGFEPGGATDVIARVMAERLKQVWGHPVVVENKPGAGGNLAAELVAKNHDGLTLLIVGPGQATNTFIYPHLAYDPVADFAPVTQLVLQPNIMAVPVGSPATSVKEFIDYCKANPGTVKFASSGNGTSLHLCGELFKRIARVDMQHVPYKGSEPALRDLQLERVDVIFDNVTSILPHVMSGNARGLAVTTAKRIPAAPNLPTLIEAGVPGFDVSTWIGALAPARIGAERQQALHAALMQALAAPAVRQILAQQGLEWVGSTPAEFDAFMSAEGQRWNELVIAQKLSFG